MSMSALALSQPAPSNGCRLVATDGRICPLRSVEVITHAGGGLASVRLRQTFANPYDEPLHATYLLPLPADGAVVDFCFTLAGRRIAGRVERRADARAAFEAAVLEGRTAALLEQERSSMFTQEIGNIPPGAEIHVEIDVEQPLRWTDGGWEWRWPTVVGPRYLGTPSETPDADRITVDVADRPLGVVCNASVAVTDALTGAPTSPSHPLQAVGDGQGQRTFALSGALDRDAVIRWPVAAPAPEVRIECTRPDGSQDAYGLLTLVPPAVVAAPVSRDLCLLLDTSGSMGGSPLEQLKAFSTALVDGLRDGDQLEMIEFSSSPTRWRPAPIVIDARTRADALRWIASLRAGGGTAMHEAVTEAMRPLRAEAERQVVLMTDGYIGFEQEVIRRIRQGLPPGSRIHTVGIGSSVNRTLTSGVARAGGGHEAIVGVSEPVGIAVSELLARTGDPQWIDVTISGSAVRQVAPAVIGDLLAGSPSRVSVRLDPAGGTLVLSARSASGSVRRELVLQPVQPGHGRRVLATRFARERVEDLENGLSGGDAAATVDAAIEALGLEHRIATRMTSWIAVTDEVTVDPGEPTRRETIPHELPHGVSAEGVGLRSVAPGTSTLNLAQPAPAPAGPIPVQSAADAKVARPAKRKLSEEKKEDSVRRRSGRALPSEPAPSPARPGAPVRSPAPPPPPREMRQERERMASPDSEADEAFGDVQEEAEEVVRLPSSRRTLRARVVTFADGRLVIEATLEQDEDWSPDPVTVRTADGAHLVVTPVNGTTRAGRVGAGRTVRLVIGWTGALPTSLDVGMLRLLLPGA